MDMLLADRMLADAGLRRTQARREVLIWMWQRTAAVSHGEVESSLAHLDRVTVYRVLQSFEESGLAHKVVDAQGTGRYALNRSTEIAHSPHYHFQCLGCGAVECLPSAVVVEPVLPEGYRMQKLTLSVQGLCCACAQES